MEEDNAMGWDGKRGGDGIGVVLAVVFIVSVVWMMRNVNGFG